MMNGDKLLIGLEGEWFAVDTAAIAGVVEVEKIPILPGARRFVEGIISLRNEPVTVVDLRKAFGRPSGARGGPRKVIVVRDKTRMLGLDIGDAELSFVWKEGLKEAGGAGSERFTKGFVESEGRSIRLVEWAAIYDETTRIISTEGPSV